MTPHSPDYVTREQAAKIAGITISTLQSHRFPGSHTRKSPFPEPAARFGNVPVWHRKDIEKWAAARDSASGP